MGKSSARRRLSDIDSFSPESDELIVIIETPQASRNKFKYQKEHDLFELGGVLPAGAVFPFDFGFVPSTLGEDGDPLDVLILMDQPAYPGCLVPSRLLGVIEANQTEDGKTERNDRLIAVAAEAHDHSEIRSISELSAHLIEEIEHFFVSYNEIRGKKFKPLGRFGPRRAMKLIKEGSRRFRQQNKKSNQSQRTKKK
jgi:inorganic pyrophosphatase